MRGGLQVLLQAGAQGQGTPGLRAYIAERTRRCQARAQFFGHLACGQRGHFGIDSLNFILTMVERLLCRRQRLRERTVAAQQIVQLRAQQAARQALLGGGSVGFGPTQLA